MGYLREGWLVKKGSGTGQSRGRNQGRSWNQSRRLLIPGRRNWKRRWFALAVAPKEARYGGTTTITTCGSGVTGGAAGAGAGTTAAGSESGGSSLGGGRCGTLFYWESDLDTALLKGRFDISSNCTCALYAPPASKDKNTDKKGSKSGSGGNPAVPNRGKYEFHFVLWQPAVGAGAGAGRCLELRARSQEDLYAWMGALSDVIH